MTDKIQGAPLTTSRFPVAEISTVYPVIGNPNTYTELTQAIQAHGNSQKPLPFNGSFAETRLPITSHLFKNLKLDKDNHSDFLLVRSLDVYTFPGQEAKKGSVSFLVYIPGNESTDKEGKPTDDMVRNGVLLSAAYLVGKGNPISGLELADANKDGVSEVQFAELETSKSFDAALPTDTVDNQRLYDALFAAQAFTMNTKGYLDILYAVNDIGNVAVEEEQKTNATFYNQLGFGFAALKKRFPDFKGMDAEVAAFSRAMFTQADQVLTLTKAEVDKIAELSGRSDKLMTDGLKKFRWQEGDWAKKPMTRAEFYSVLGETPDSAKRRDLTEKYSAAVLKAHKEGLFPMIDQLNAVARKHGYKNYPDYNDRVFFGMTPEDFAGLADGYHAKYGTTLAAFIKDLEKVNGGKPVYEWDVDYLSAKYIKEKTGGELPKLTFDEALAIAKRWFKDIGWDLDEEPFKGKIFFDLKKRENKYGNAFATMIDDGSKTWFNTNFDPNEKITLEDLNTVIHELTHDVQFILGAQNGGGNYATGSGAWPNTWMEGSALTMGDVVNNKDWMDRYLSDLPAFKDPKVRATAADVLEKGSIYLNMMVLCRALWENNLYQDVDGDGKPIALETRLHNWEVIAKKYMHVGTMDGTKGGYIYATPHFAGSPAYYVAYGGGRPLGVKAMEVMVDGLAKKDDDLLLRGGAVFGNVLKNGARMINAEEISEAIERAKRGFVSEVPSAPAKGMQ